MRTYAPITKIIYPTPVVLSDASDYTTTRDTESIVVTGLDAHAVKNIQVFDLTDVPSGQIAQQLIRVSAVGTKAQVVVNVPGIDTVDLPALTEAGFVELYGMGGGDQKVIRYSDGLNLRSFLDIMDGPDDYTDQAHKGVRVKGTEDGVEFYTVSDNDTTAFTELQDVPSTYASQGGKSVRVTADATGLEFFDLPVDVDLTAFTELSDVPSDYSGHAYQSVRVNSGESALEFYVVTDNDTTAFTELNDVPHDYTDQGGKSVRVTTDETGLEFFDLPTDVDLTTFLELDDVPADYSGHGLEFVRVNVGESALEFSALDPIPQGFTDLTDAPADYTGHSLQSVRVNVGESGLEFFTLPVDVDLTSFVELSDVPADYTGHGGQYVVVTGSEDGLEFVTLPVDVDLTAFVELSDVPSDYTGHSLQSVRVNVGESGLEFYTPTDTDLTTFVELDDVPSDYTGHSGQYVKVTSDETGLEFGTLPVDVDLTSFVELVDVPSSYSDQALKIVRVNLAEDALEFVDITSNDPVDDAVSIDSTEGQTVYNLGFSYDLGHNELLVFSGGLYMRLGEDFTESSTTSIEFFDGRMQYEKVSVIKLSNVSGISSGLIKTFTKVDATSDYTCATSFLRIYANTTDSTFNITFPNAPVDEDEIEVINTVDSFSANNLVLDGNGKNIHGSTDFTVDVNESTSQVYHSVYGWLMK